MAASRYFKNLFKAADADGNGLLEACELKEHLEVETKIHEYIKTAMKDEGKVEIDVYWLVDPFLACLNSLPGHEHFKQTAQSSNNLMVKDLFKTMDTNGDGFIDLEEVKIAEEARENKHRIFLKLMQEVEKEFPEGLTEDKFCELAGKRLTDEMVRERQMKNKNL